MKRLLWLLPLVAACKGGDVPPAVPPRAPQPRPDVMGTPQAPLDPLGAKPASPEPAPFTPPVPAVYEHASGVTVWLLERHTLPIVSMQLVVRGGASWQKKEGAAWAAATMLDEGAGKRGALDISRDLDRLGATLQTGALPDYSFAQLTVLKKNLAPASGIFSDVVAKPTFSPVEWTRVKGLWLNDLRQRQSDPSAVSRVVLQRKVLAGTPYEKPVNGTLKGASALDLADVKDYYADFWQPRHATCVVVGDVTRAELDPVLDATFGPWKNGTRDPFTNRHLTEAPRPKGAPGVFLVDRADAPQSVIAVGRRGVEAQSVALPPLLRVNAALGGSFTSRLNQDLREEHGWSYGARSSFTWTAMRGMFSAVAAVHTEHTGDALKATLANIESMAKKGLTDEEVAKTRMLARSELVESFEGVDGAAARLARNAGVGLRADHEAKASQLLYGATKEDLAKLAAEFLALDGATMVVVGPRAKVLPQMEALGLGKIESATPEGD